jgi:hypothetical protein
LSPNSNPGRPAQAAAVDTVDYGRPWELIYIPALCAGAGFLIGSKVGWSGLATCLSASALAAIGLILTLLALTASDATS